MKRTTYQVPELRDENDNIIQDGTFGKHSAFSNATNDGAFDYILNNLEALYDAQTAAGNAITTGGLTVSGKTTTGTLEASSATVSGQTTTGTLAAGDTTVTGSITTTGLTVTGTTSVPTANAGNSSKAIANTEYVQGELTNYLPLSGGTLTGLTVTGATSVPTANAGNSSKAIANTEFVAKSIASLVNGAPDQLNTLNELAKALGNDANFASTVTNAIAAKVAKAGDTITGDVDITGDLSVSGAITGNVTGNVTGAATSATNDGNGNNIASTYLPAVVGVVQAFAGSTTPQGWLLCDGSAVSRTGYAALYAVIGTTYGAGDGSTTFNLPNLVDKFIQGNAKSGTVKAAGLPNITGSVTVRQYVPIGNNFNGGALKGVAGDDDTNAANVCGLSSAKHGRGFIYLDASQCNSIYGKSTTVQPPALTMKYIIKY